MDRRDFCKYLSILPVIGTSFIKTEEKLPQPINLLSVYKSPFYPEHGDLINFQITSFFELNTVFDIGQLPVYNNPSYNPYIDYTFNLEYKNGSERYNIRIYDSESNFLLKICNDDLTMENFIDKWFNLIPYTTANGVNYLKLQDRLIKMTCSNWNDKTSMLWYPDYVTGESMKKAFKSASNLKFYY